MRKTGSLGLAVLTAASLAAGIPGARADQLAPGFKSENAAFAYSLFGTALPIAAGAYVDSRGDDSDLAPVLAPIAVGAIIGPSLGHFYAERSRRALVGIGVRGAAMGLFWIEAGRDTGSEAPGTPLMVLSVLVGATSLIADVLDAPGSARRHNRERGLSAPRVIPSPIGQAMAPGLRVDWTF